MGVLYVSRQVLSTVLLGTCLLGRDRTAARGHPQPFQDEMLPTCPDPSAVVCAQSYVCQWSYESHQSGMQNSTSEVITGVLPCCWPFRIIKHPVITRSEKWYTLFALFVLQAGAAHGKVICYPGVAVGTNVEDSKDFGGFHGVKCQETAGCQDELHPQPRGRRSAKKISCRHNPQYRPLEQLNEVQLSVSHNIKQHTS